jgi:hypothetical protein
VPQMVMGFSAGVNGGMPFIPVLYVFKCSVPDSHKARSLTSPTFLLQLEHCSI